MAKKQRTPLGKLFSKDKSNAKDSDREEKAIKAETSLKRNTCDCLQKKSDCYCKQTKLTFKNGKYNIEPIG